MEWTQQLVAQQKQRTEKLLKETERIKAVADAERLKEIQSIDISKDIQQEEGKANISSIQNDIMAKKRVILTMRISHIFYFMAFIVSYYYVNIIYKFYYLPKNIENGI